eukprot:jgi/Tetstr1/436723/TSEL_025506.t1
MSCLGQRPLDLLSNYVTAQTLKSYAGKLSQLAEMSHDSENISPLEASTATIVRYVAWIVSGHRRVARHLHHFIDNIQPALCMVRAVVAATNFWAVTSSEQSKSRTAATMSDGFSTAVRLVGAAPPAGTSWSSHSLRKDAAFGANAIGVPLSHIRHQGSWATNSDGVPDYIDPHVLPSPCTWFFLGHIAPLRNSKLKKDFAAVTFPVSPLL